ncbi:DEAD/DEAH box helicase [Nocardia sp. NPDC058114]|uniref:DEAD/DEAH box helicase n=1 Tax=Nocardia sp. NPDC058114 TaxID=3346346 RepID=UPI0036D8D1DD
MIWREGILPEDAPEFGPLLDYDLLSYGYALLGSGLRLIEAEGSRQLSRRAFENAAAAIESVIARGPDADDREFHRVVAAAAYHLGGFSARAYSLLSKVRNSAQTTSSEQCLVLLMLRRLDDLSALIFEWRAESRASDAELVTALERSYEAVGVDDLAEEDVPDVIDVVDLALTDAFMAAMSVAMLAFERGDAELLDDAVHRLRTGLDAAGELNLVPQWWCHRLAIHLIDGLWQASFHAVLPVDPLEGGGKDWQELRATFIATLLRRRRAEIELWPSQLEAAARALDTHDNLVLSLPTSAGKTRIAELCILATLAERRRIVVVTPLRALSAQTEAILERTFVPLGKTVSSLYGTTGLSEVDQDILGERNIIVATPEKLDFALRNDPDLLNDVGLVVLDEGHMIGQNEREVRYEIQVQRLLRRPDAASRRIVCLSAILPDGDQMQDFVNWLTDDQPAGLIANSWRPTTLRYGEITWHDDHARLTVTVGSEKPFVPRFLTAFIPPKNGRRISFPNDQQELTLASAWQLVDEGQTVLIFCPLRKSVNSLAKAIVKLNRQGALRNVFEGDAAQLNTALTIGEEWLGPRHPILACLKLGVAVHHGSLPTPYRKEVERLLREGILKITVSSPTLAQGLNLSASALIVHSIWRDRVVIKASEFRNIVGRAGRAFVDSVGLVLHPLYENKPWDRPNWQKLVDDSTIRDMSSGLMQLVQALLIRMQRKLGDEDFEVLIDYVAGNAAWDFPELSGEDAAQAAKAPRKWREQLSSLDCALLSLLNDSAVDEVGIEEALDNALASSLWTRSVARRQDAVQIALRAGLSARARFLWDRTTATQRRSYFLAGVGLETGRKLDENADVLNQHLRDAERSILDGDDHGAIAAITQFAAIALAIEPFAPLKLSVGWEATLAGWLEGKTVVEIAADDTFDALELIEDTLAYRLPWAMEAVRVRASAHECADDAWLLIEPDQGHAVAAVEAGTLNRSAALLMRAGFSSRSGAIAAVLSESGQFTTLAELHLWLGSADVRRHADDDDWPTPTTHDLWTGFTNRSVASGQKTWTHTVEYAAVTWFDDHPSSSAAPYRAVSYEGRTFIDMPDGRRVGFLNEPLNPKRAGLLEVSGISAENTVELNYRGPADLYG